MTQGNIPEGVKVISHNASGYVVPDDPSMPYKLEAALSAPQFMQVAFIFMVGPQEKLVIRAASLDALRKFWHDNGLYGHPRLLKCSVTGPDGAVDFDSSPTHPSAA